MNNINLLISINYSFLVICYFLNVQKKKRIIENALLYQILYRISVYNFDSLSYNNSPLFSLLLYRPNHNGTVMCLTFSRHLLLSALGQCRSYSFSFSFLFLYLLSMIYIYIFFVLGTLHDICNIKFKWYLGIFS